MGESLEIGKSLPGWLLYPATLMVLVILIYPFYRVRSVISRYILFALSFRYLMSAHHEFTFDPSPAGISWNALGSILVFLMGVMLIRTRHLLLTTLIPFYAVVGVVVMSAYVNHALGNGIDVVVKFGFLIIISIAVYEAISERGEERTMSLLLWAMVTPVLFQFLSVVFGISKGAEDRSAGISYVGGYNHEAGFSTVLATGFVIACFATGLRLWVRGGALLTFLCGLLLANYRTAILAFSPMVFMQFNADVISRFSPRVRVIIGVVILAVSTAGIIAAAWTMREKFADLAVIYSDPGRVIKPPSEYTPDDKELLSGRPWIWSNYIDGYLNGGIRNWLLGFGPNAWVGRFPVYAHNTLVSTLFEYGIVGVLAMLVLWGWMVAAALRAKHGPKGKLLAAHASFLLLNQATMPHWTIEGNLLYGIICGYTFYLLLGPATKSLPTEPAPNSSLAPLSRPNILK